MASCSVTGNVAVGGGGIRTGGTQATISQSTVASNVAAFGGGGIATDNASIERTIMWGNCADPGNDLFVEDSDIGDVTLICCAIDSSGVFSDGQLTYDGPQVWSDPVFCNPARCSDAPTEKGDYTLRSNSPCLPQVSPCGGLIARFDQGCEATPTVQATWGRIKVMMRER